MAKPDKGGLVKFEIGIPDSLKDDNCNDEDDDDCNEGDTGQILMTFGGVTNLIV